MYGLDSCGVDRSGVVNVELVIDQSGVLLGFLKLLIKLVIGLCGVYQYD